MFCSRWEEPFGRTSLEAASAGCAVIISNRGGLPETITNAVILKDLNVETLYKSIDNLITNKQRRSLLQKLSIKNFYLTHEFVSKNIDSYRDEKFKFQSFFVNKIINPTLRILHATNFNERHDGRLFLILVED